MQLRSCIVLTTSVILSALLSGYFVSCTTTGRTLKGAVHDAQTQTDPIPSEHDETIVDNEDDDFYHPTTITGKQDARYKNLMIVSTLDGKLSALDADHEGQLLWSINVGAKPLLSSSISTLEVFRNGRNSRLIPSLDGTLYQFNGEDLERLPFNSDTLLSASLKLTEDTMVVGNRDVTIFAVSPYTGQVKYICGSNGCGLNQDSAIDEDIITIRRRSHTVRAIHITSGEEKWNYSVGQHEIEFIDSNGSQNGDSFFSKATSVKVYVPDGTIVSTSEGDLDQELWRYQFGSPITKAWKLVDGTLEEVSMFDCKYVPTLYNGQSVLSDQPMLFFGMHHGQLYVQPSVSGVEAPREALEEYLRGFMNKEMGRDLARRVPKIRWKPYLATAPSRTPHIRTMAKLLDYDHTKEKKDQTTPEEYPFDSGYYLIPDVTYLPDYLDQLEDRSEQRYLEDQNHENDTAYFYYINESIWVWWKEIIAISLCTSIFVQVLMNHVVFVRQPEQSQNSQSSQNKERTISESSKSDEMDYQPTGASFVSRFHTDFDVIETLGKGGFGVVFKAKNKMDELEYAVKRICVKNTSKSREKVLREARAMAKLEHVGIIRYYQVFVETPPVGWQKQKDLELFGPETTSTMSTPVTETPVTPDPMSIIPESVAKKFKNPLQIFDDSNSSAPSFTSKKPVDCTRSDSLEIVFGEDSNSTQDNKKIPFSNYTKSVLNCDSGCSDVSTHKGDGDLQYMDTTTESATNSKPAKQEGKEIISLTSGSGSFSIINNDQEAAIQEEKPPKLYLYIQMQLCERNTLKDWLSANTLKRDCTLLLDYFTQIVNAVAYVHDCALIHRDLKPSNIYFSVSDNNIIKVGDFGLVTAHEEEESSNQDFSDTDNRGHTNQVGTQLYMSPEQMKGLHYGQKVDIFSLGLIFLEFFYPCSTQMEKITVLSDAKKQKLPSRFVRELKQESEFVRWLTKEDPSERPTAVEMLESALLRDVVPSTSHGHRRTNSVSVRKRKK